MTAPHIPAPPGTVALYSRKDGGFEIEPPVPFFDVEGRALVWDDSTCRLVLAEDYLPVGAEAFAGVFMPTTDPIVAVIPVIEPVPIILETTDRAEAVAFAYTATGEVHPVIDCTDQQLDVSDGHVRPWVYRHHWWAPSPGARRTVHDAGFEALLAYDGWTHPPDLPARYYHPEDHGPDSVAMFVGGQLALGRGLWELRPNTAYGLSSYVAATRFHGDRAAAALAITRAVVPADLGLVLPKRHATAEEAPTCG